MPNFGVAETGCWPGFLTYWYIRKSKSKRCARYTENRKCVEPAEGKGITNCQLRITNGAKRLIFNSCAPVYIYGGIGYQ